MSNRNLVVLQARMSSSRLPGKVMMEINGMPMIYWQVQRILRAKKVNSLVVATSTDSTDDSLAEFLEKNSIDVYRGSLGNVLSRFIEVAETYPHDALIRLTGDCPLVMAELIDKMVDKFYEQGVDYLSNTLKPTFPDGLDIEIVKSSILKKISKFKLERRELEHVTYGIYTRPESFKLSNYQNESDRSLDRWTVDYQEDLDFVRFIFRQFSGRETEFTYQEVIELMEEYPQLQAQNHRFKRNEHLQDGENHG
jgi:spore coat polysaccharide biosynthesis protein SpsF